MMTPSKMEFISCVVLREKAQEVAAQIVRMGLVHPVDPRDIEEPLKSLSSFDVAGDSAGLDMVEAQLRETCRMAGCDAGRVIPSRIEPLNFKEAHEYLEGVQRRLAPVLEKRDQLREELRTDQAILAHVKDYIPMPVKRPGGYSFLQISTGKIEEKNIVVLQKSFADVPHVLYPFRKDGIYVYAMFIGLRRDRLFIDKVLSDVGWETVEFPSEARGLSAQAQSKLAEKIRETEDRLKEQEDKVKAVADEHKDRIDSIATAVHVQKSLLEAKRLSVTTDKTVVFSGWVPSENSAEAVRRIKEISGISCVEIHKPEDMAIDKEEIPVSFSHSAALKPFGMLIESYGLPRYGTIDPTAFVAISFLIMFGAMFGDIGHGLVLGLVGLLLGGKGKSPQLKQVKALLLYCGISSAVFGALYGSFFGFEFKSLWLKPIENIMEVFKLSVYFGIGLISVGIIINIINSFRDKNYSKALFDKSGLIGGIIYWAAIGLVTKSLISQSSFPTGYAIVIAAGVFALFMFPLVKCIMHKKFSSFFEVFMESLVGILEVFMGYLANTVSFIRVAAFSLAHAGLFIAIFSLAKIVHTPGGMGVVKSAIVEILGNILVICLEGLVVSIQAVRLNYYEFFSKFFIAGKRLYKPLSL